MVPSINSERVVGFKPFIKEIKKCSLCIIEFESYKDVGAFKDPKESAFYHMQLIALELVPYAALKQRLPTKKTLCAKPRSVDICHHCLPRYQGHTEKSQLSLRPG